MSGLPYLKGQATVAQERGFPKAAYNPGESVLLGDGDCAMTTGKLACCQG